MRGDPLKDSLTFGIILANAVEPILGVGNSSSL